MGAVRLHSIAVVMLLLLIVADVGVATAQQVDVAVPGRRVSLTQHALAFEYADQTSLTNGVDGDSQLVFVAEPLSQRVVVIDRLTGQQVGLLPAPPIGFVLPFSSPPVRSSLPIVSATWCAS